MEQGHTTIPAVFADPDAGLAFGYLMNRPGERWNNPRTERLLDALYRCL